MNSNSPKSKYFADVLFPGGLNGVLTYAVPEHLQVKKGTLVNAPLRKKMTAGLVWRVHDQKPAFKTEEIAIHPADLTFEERWMQTLEWVSKYNLCTLNRGLDVFWPKAHVKWLEWLEKMDKVNKAGPELLPPKEPPQLHPMQSKVVEPIVSQMDSGEFHANLLHGVTGSGKSRVYLELVKEARKRGKRILILVPEIGLTPQTHGNFQNFLEEEVFVWHSGLSTPRRRRTWLKLLDGKVNVLLGTRSSILLPFLNPDLIIVDEEHDSSYKQHDPSPRYHARELALHLAHRHKGILVLGSATPSLESWQRAKDGHLHLLQMKERVNPVPLPEVHVCDLKEQQKIQGSSLLSIPLREALQGCVSQNRQAIVLHNRRGYATTRVCADCGEVMECQDCKIPVIQHKKKNTLLCHYCDRCYPIDTPCRHCGSKEVIPQGSGIEMAEDELNQDLSDAKVIRMDRDTTANQGSLEALLEDFRAGNSNVLLGTQMVAKGHDFPGVDLVGVISADSGSAIPDFRGNERTFQLLTQVAGRAGRSSGKGEVWLQSWAPENQVLQFALKHDFESFADWELANRKELNYPPFSKLVLAELSGRDARKVYKAMDRFHFHLQQGAHQLQIQILGPSEAFVSEVL